MMVQKEVIFKRPIPSSPKPKINKTKLKLIDSQAKKIIIFLNLELTILF